MPTPQSVTHDFDVALAKATAPDSPSGRKISHAEAAEVMKALGGALREAKQALAQDGFDQVTDAVGFALMNRAENVDFVSNKDFDALYNLGVDMISTPHESDDS